MPVENVKSDLIHDYLDENSTPPDPARARGRLICAIGTVASAAGASALSSYHLADIPADAILHEDTFFDVENYGFAQVVIGTSVDTSALVDVLQSAADLIQPIAVGDANHGKPLWKTLGLAANPGGNIALYAHAEATATGAGSMPFRIAYLYH